MMMVTNMNSGKAKNADYMFMVEHAIKAPSGHNTQPWLFKMNDNSIEIHPNPDKFLPVVDFDNRELFISLGCATENLCISASTKGYNSKVVIDDNGIITVNLVKDKDIVSDSLFEFIDLRQTNRSVYNGKIISDSTINKLRTIPLADGINLYFYKKETADFYSILNCVIEGNNIQMQDKAFKDELKSWIRFNKSHSKKTNDGLSYAVFGAPNLPIFIVKPIMAKAINAKAQNKGDIKKMQSSSHFVLFTTQSNTVKEWVNLGRNLKRLLLKSTELGIIHAYLNQPNEIRDLSQQMAKTLGIPNEHTSILLRIGYGEKMPYSKRKEIKDVIIK